jgi:hypothetical protein
MASHPVIERYIAELSVRLPGPRRWRVAVLDEMRDSLLEGIHAHSDTEHDPAVAAVHAIADHGPVAQVAGAYAPELAVAWTRRASLLALAVVPAMAIVWNVALRVGPPSHWHPSGTGLHIAATMIAGGVGLTLTCSTATLLGTGRLARTIGDHLRAARVAVCAASVAVTIAVLALLSVVAARALSAPGSLEWPAVLTALAVSLTALARVAHASYRGVTSIDAAR